MPDASLTDLAHGSMPFTAELGLTVDEGSPERVVARADWRADRCTVGGALHGGYLMAVADSVGALCAFLNLPPGAGTSTIESKTNFLRAATEGEITITSEPLHVGRTTVVVVTDVLRADGKLVSRTTQTQAVLPGP
ncbi:MAG: PaaI family thioesterase [Acidimicrobiia bacterium]